MTRCVSVIFRKITFCMWGVCIISYVNPASASEDPHGRTDSGAEYSHDVPRKISDIVKISAQLRLRGDFVKNQNLGDFSFRPDTHDEQIVSRTRLSLSCNPINEIKGFVQGQFYTRQNHRDFSKTNVYQAYLEISDIDHIPLGLRIGRQELCYGSAFFLGANDFYEGLTWDGAKLKIEPRDNLWIDLIGAWYVKLDKNTSDNEPALYGAYSSYKPTETMDMDLYLFYHKGGFKFFHTDLPDSPRWFTLGARMAGGLGDQIDYEIEPLYQFGKIDNPETAERDTITAYGGHIEGGYTFKSKFNPRLFAGYAFGSGDNDTTDKKYQEFHGNVYNDNYLVGDTSIIPDLSGVTVGDHRASGMHIVITGLSLDINPKLNLNLDYHYFEAHKTPAGISKELGSEVNVIATYTLLPNITIIVSANRFLTGNFFEDADGSSKDINYFYLQAQIEF